MLKSTIQFSCDVLVNIIVVWCLVIVYTATTVSRRSHAGPLDTADSVTHTMSEIVIIKHRQHHHRHHGGQRQECECGSVEILLRKQKLCLCYRKVSLVGNHS